MKGLFVKNPFPLTFDKSFYSLGVELPVHSLYDSYKVDDSYLNCSLSQRYMVEFQQNYYLYMHRKAPLGDDPSPY